LSLLCLHSSVLFIQPFSFAHDFPCIWPLNPAFLLGCCREFSSMSMGPNWRR
jgi:hypothetical protein